MADSFNICYLNLRGGRIRARPKEWGRETKQVFSTGSTLSIHSTGEIKNVVLAIQCQNHAVAVFVFEVRIGGLEPPRLAPLDPKSNAATNYAISAFW